MIRKDIDKTTRKFFKKQIRETSAGNPGSRGKQGIFYMKNNSLPVLTKGNDHSIDRLNTISTPLEYGELHRSTEATSKIMTR